MENNSSDDMHARLCSPYVYVVLIAFLAIAAFYLIAEHRVHLYGYLSWLPLAALIALHFWMHASHRHGGHSSHDSQTRHASTLTSGDTHAIGSAGIWIVGTRGPEFGSFYSIRL
jgi:cyanate permease